MNIFKRIRGAVTEAVIAEWNRSCNAGEMWLMGSIP